MTHRSVPPPSLSLVPCVSPDENAVPARPTPPEPYEVRIRDGVGDSATIIGYDGSCRVLVELHVPARHISDDLVGRVKRWVSANGGPPVYLVP